MSNRLPVICNTSGELGLARLDRPTRRELDRVQSAGLVLAAQNIARVDAIADVTEAALIAASHISATEALLASRLPHAAVRLQHIADAGCLGMVGVVLGMSRVSR